MRHAILKSALFTCVCISVSLSSSLAGRPNEVKGGARVILTRPVPGATARLERLGAFELLSAHGIWRYGSKVFLRTDTGREVVIPFWSDLAARDFVLQAMTAETIDLTSCQHRSGSEGFEADEENAGCGFYSSPVVFKCALLSPAPRINVRLPESMAGFGRSDSNGPIAQTWWGCPESLPKDR